MKQGCKCKTTRCKTALCSCFHDNKKCLPLCQCIGCFNKSSVPLGKTFSWPWTIIFNPLWILKIKLLQNWNACVTFLTKRGYGNLFPLVPIVRDSRSPIFQHSLRRFHVCAERTSTGGSVSWECDTGTEEKEEPLHWRPVWVQKVPVPALQLSPGAYSVCGQVCLLQTHMWKHRYVYTVHAL